MKNDIIRFIKSKEYKYLKEVGQGGTGRTILIKDETINERFVCKKRHIFQNVRQNIMSISSMKSRFYTR